MRLQPSRRCVRISANFCGKPETIPPSAGDIHIVQRRKHPLDADYAYLSAVQGRCLGHLRDVTEKRRLLFAIVAIIETMHEYDLQVCASNATARTDVSMGTRIFARASSFFRIASTSSAALSRSQESPQARECLHKCLQSRRRAYGRPASRRYACRRVQIVRRRLRPCSRERRTPFRRPAPRRRPVPPHRRACDARPSRQKVALAMMSRYSSTQPDRLVSALATPAMRSPRAKRRAYPSRGAAIGWGLPREARNCLRQA